MCSTRDLSQNAAQFGGGIASNRSSLKDERWTRATGYQLRARSYSFDKARAFAVGEQAHGFEAGGFEGGDGAARGLVVRIDRRCGSKDRRQPGWRTRFERDDPA